MEKFKLGNWEVPCKRLLSDHIVTYVAWLPNGRDLRIEGLKEGGHSLICAPTLFHDTAPYDRRTRGLERWRNPLLENTGVLSPDGRHATSWRTVQPQTGSTQYWIDLHCLDGGKRSLNATLRCAAPPKFLEYTRSGGYLLEEGFGTETCVRDLQGRELAAFEYLASNFGYGFHEPSGTIYNPLAGNSAATSQLRSFGRRPGTIERFTLSGSNPRRPEVWAEQAHVQSLCLHPSGAWLAAYGHGEICAWEVPSGRQINKISLPKNSFRAPAVDGAEYVSLDFNAAGNLLVISDGSKIVIVRAFDGGGLEPLGAIDLCCNNGGVTTRVCFSAKTDIFYVYHRSPTTGTVATVDLTPLAAPILRRPEPPREHLRLV